jgi:hypothetical protein
MVGGWSGMAWDRLGCSGIEVEVWFPHAQIGGCLEGPLAPEGPWGRVPAASQGGLGTFPVARRASQYGKDGVVAR